MPLEKENTNDSSSEVSMSSSRKRTLNTYSKRLTVTDQKVGRFIQQVITETTRAYRTTMVLYVISYGVLLSSVLIGLLLIFLELEIDNQFILTLLCLLGGIFGLILMNNRSPVKNFRYLSDHLVKLNIIFSAYTRQIHQVDAVFEDMLSGEKEIPPVVAEQLLKNLQDVMAEAMNAISQVSIDMDI